MFGWDTEIEIFEPRANGMFITKDVGKRIKRDNTLMFSLRKEKTRTKPISPQFVYLNDKKKHCLKLLKVRTGVYFPLRVNPQKMEFDVMDEDTRRWIVMDEREAWERFKAKNIWWKEYFPIIAMAIFGVVLAIIIWASAGYMETIASNLGSVASALANTANVLVNAPLA